MTHTLIEELKRRSCKRPFEPFRVVLSDGTHLDVTRVMQLGFGPVEFGYAPPTAKRAVRGRLADIVAVEALDGAETATA